MTEYEEACFGCGEFACDGNCFADEDDADETCAPHCCDSEEPCP